MTASSNNGDTFLPKFGRLEGTSAWCPGPAEMVLDGPYLQIDMGQKYVICGVEAQGLPGVSVTTSFNLSFSDDDSAYTGYNSDQVIGKTAEFVTCISVTFPLPLPPFLLLPFVTFPLPLPPSQCHLPTPPVPLFLSFYQPYSDIHDYINSGTLFLYIHKNNNCFSGPG